MRAGSIILESLVKQSSSASPNPLVWRNLWHFLAFGAGSGLMPKAPGTWGSLAALPFVPLLGLLPVWLYGALLVLGALFGIWLCGKVADELKVHDHEGIVWDEWVGIWITFFLAPTSWPWLIAGFALFRLFDILKPWPISWVDRRVSGGLGIMLDDLLAGVATWAALQVLIWGWG